MNRRKIITGLLPLLTAFSLVGCGENANKPKPNPGINDDEDEEQGPIEIGDSVKHWTNTKKFSEAPLGISSNSSEGTGSVEVETTFGREDKVSLYYTLNAGSNKKGVLGTDFLENPYFTEDDAKNGDIISLYFYLPSDSNIASLQLSAKGSGRDVINGDVVSSEDKNEEWIRTVISYDTLDTLGGIRLNYEVVDASLPAKFYIDDIDITLGEETVSTGYVSNDESLYKTYEDYFKVGACMSNNMLKNTTIRKIAKENFNSLTAENEGKPEQILDQTKCQEAAQNDPAAVVIKTTPFEKLYNWCEANHIGVRHHTFVWYSQTPGWFFTTNYTQNGPKASRELMLQRMENFIGTTLDTINERWPGLVYAVDVSNEAIENGGLRTNNNNWYNTVGEDFVYYAFKYASQYKAEDQKLFYNDFSFDYNTNHCKYALDTLLKKAIEEELIDGVGIQGHIDSNANLENIMTDARMIQAKGLECQITELDITVNGTSDQNLEQQKTAYKNLTKKILEANIAGETNVTAYVVWGINDDASWKSNQNPLLFDRTFKKKPAYYGVLEAIQDIVQIEE
ncbi:MAG: endo-1,4-beta-xylanase [Bacilli bacterium]|nr:endo-1,4-beta-xylanase [Bacilli bacterium]